jgi:hypothetical protein
MKLFHQPPYQQPKAPIQPQRGGPAASKGAALALRSDLHAGACDCDDHCAGCSSWTQNVYCAQRCIGS